jgi:hypothetical protein
VISGSAWIRALQVLSTAEMKAEGSAALRGVLDWLVSETAMGISGGDWIPAGGRREDHFQPGVSVGSSRRERIRSLVCCSSGRRRRVMENPGIFKLVFVIVSLQLVGYRQNFLFIP